MEVLLYTTRLSIIACRHIVPYYYSGEPKMVVDIAEVYGFKARSLNPAFTALVKAGILKSRVGGKCNERGFLFAKDPKEVTLYDIVKALEGDEPAKCCSAIISCPLDRLAKCDIYKELQKVVDKRKEILSATTIYEQYKNIEK